MNLTKTNSVTISHSCLDNLPPGQYHFSVFDGLDIQKPQDTIEKLKEEIRQLNEQIESYEIDINIHNESVEEISGLREDIESLEIENGQLRDKLEEIHGIANIY